MHSKKKQSNEFSQADVRVLSKAQEIMNLLGITKKKISMALAKELTNLFREFSKEQTGKIARAIKLLRSY